MLRDRIDPIPKALEHKISTATKPNVKRKWVFKKPTKNTHKITSLLQLGRIQTRPSQTHRGSDFQEKKSLMCDVFPGCNVRAPRGGVMLSIHLWDFCGTFQPSSSVMERSACILSSNSLRSSLCKHFLPNPLKQE